MQYIPNTDRDIRQMLDEIGVDSVGRLFDDIPASKRSPHLDLPPALSEMELVRELKAMASRNVTLENHACFLGAGAYYHYVPAAVHHITGRSEFYTAYTPYQPEISQGTLQAIFEYQTAVCELTGMDVANASVYDAATAVAEAVHLAVSVTHRQHAVIAPTLHPHYLKVLRTYSAEAGIVISAQWDQAAWLSMGKLDVNKVLSVLDSDTACLVVQQPNFFGCLEDVQTLADAAHAVGALFIVVADPISLGLLKSPGSYGADIVVGEGQSLGNPLSFGGPYLGLFAAREKFMRQMPGRIIGQTVDSRGQVAYVLTMQAREQHIRREKATSNICSNEALNALAALVYLSVMGKHGLRRVAELSLRKAHYAAQRIAEVPGFSLAYPTPFFKEFVVRCPSSAAEINQALLREGIIGGLDLGSFSPGLADSWLLCVTEMNTKNEIDYLIEVLRKLRKGGNRSWAMTKIGLSN